jgi:hypothetical protein
VTEKIRVSDKESSYLYSSPNGDSFRIFGHGVFDGEFLIGVIATNSKSGRPLYRARVIRDGICTAQAEFMTMPKAIKFVSEQTTHGKS